MKKLHTEIWTSTHCNSEIHHFLGKSKATYVFGFNPQLISQKTYKKILELIQKEL